MHDLYIRHSLFCSQNKACRCFKCMLTTNPVDRCIVLSELIMIIRVTIGYIIRKLFDILPNGSKYFDVSKFPINPKTYERIESILLI